MKRLSLILPLLLFCIAGFAQIQFGYVNYEQVLKELPEYAKAQEDLAALKAKYEAEAQKGEEEFQNKFVDFLQDRRTSRKLSCKSVKQNCRHLWMQEFLSALSHRN